MVIGRGSENYLFPISIKPSRVSNYTEKFLELLFWVF